MSQKLTATVLQQQLHAQRLVNDALAEQLRRVTIERDRFFDMKRANAGRVGEIRESMHALQERIRVVYANLGGKDRDEIIDMIEGLLNG